MTGTEPQDTDANGLPIWVDTPPRHIRLGAATIHALTTMTAAIFRLAGRDRIGR